jgi:hypothetical protein
MPDIWKAIVISTHRKRRIGHIHLPLCQLARPRVGPIVPWLLQMAQTPKDVSGSTMDILVAVAQHSDRKGNFPTIALLPSSINAERESARLSSGCVFPLLLHWNLFAFHFNVFS